MGSKSRYPGSSVIKQNPQTASFSIRQNCLATGILLSVISFVLGLGQNAQAEPAMKELFNSITANMQSKKTMPLALSQVDQLLKKAPDNPAANQLKAAILSCMDEYEEALPCIERAAKLDPSSVRIWSRKADILHHLKQDKEALSCIDKAEKLNGKSLTNANKADILISLNRTGDAEKELDRLVETVPDNSTFRGHRAELFLHTNQWEKAINDLTILIQQCSRPNQSFALLHSKRADCYFHLNQYTRSIADYKSALTIDPDDRQIHAALMKIYNLTGDTRAASAEKKFVQSLDTDLRLYK
jgi:predicted Zn-dependent protease